ncbi:MAG: putative metal-binding motif-containing protein, partial [Deltaproteobacteria bacterium]|nr:putative metal-binding motif-containing protein [Deltaproteobacteria bacterium]
ADNDGFQDDNCGGTDCDDGDPNAYPGAPETCGDNIDQDCDGQDLVCCADADGDGYQDDNCGGTDCDDGDPNAFPSASEICGDNVDQDCDGHDLVCCTDADGDGFDDQACGGTDCDDGDPAAYPGAPETCDDNVDQDCDGQDLVCGCADADSDGFADQACGGNDCDDSAPAVNPSAAENCSDQIDNDCDGDTDAADQACNVDPVGDPQGSSLTPWNGYLSVGPAKVYFSYAGYDTGGAIVGGVAMATKDGSAAWCIACDTGHPREVITDASSVYWTDIGMQELRKAPLGGGQVASLWTGQIGTPLTVDANHVYFYDEGARCVMQVDLDGQNAAVVEANQNEVHSLAVDSGFLYWISHTQTQDTLFEKDLSGGSLSALAQGIQAQGTFPMHSVRVDASHVFWAQGPYSGLETIQRLDRAGGNQVQLSAVGAYALALDQAYVYAADNHDGEILRVPKAGGLVEILASGQQFPFDVAVDDTAVYWSSEIDAKVARVMK